MIVVFDTNVVVEAIFWPRSTARRALTGLARRRFKTAVNAAILNEYSTITADLRKRLFPQAQPSGALAWIAAKSIHVSPMPLFRKLSRDPDDTCSWRQRSQLRPSSSSPRIATCWCSRNRSAWLLSPRFRL